MSQPVLIIGGPSASGKSALAMDLAESLKGVIINADSLQIYKGLPILTAQPTLEDQRKIPHRLYSSLSPFEQCTAAIWRDLVRQEIDLVHATKALPIVVGGTGLYLKALTDGLSFIPPIPDFIREESRRIQKDNLHQLWEDIERLDSDSLMKLHPKDQQRIARAWEVLKATGKPLRYWQKKKSPVNQDYKMLPIVVLPPRKEVYNKSEKRFDEMLTLGVMDEIATFASAYPLRDLPLSKALGALHLLDVLEGKSSLEEAVILSKTATRHYIKRQYTWFRHQFSALISLETYSTQEARQQVKKVLKEL